jgi:hypothetical protein
VSGLDVGQLGLYVVRPTLTALASAAPMIDGPIAETLLLATAAQESGFRKLHQDGGPALGLWQMEPATEQEIWRWLRAAEPHLAAAVMRMASERPASQPWQPDDSELIGNLRYACAMARMVYWRQAAELPNTLDARGLQALWVLYKQYYNTPKGAATVGEFLGNYWALVAPYWPPS